MENARKTKNSKITAIRLPWATVREIDALVGRGNRSKFIAAAVKRELKRQARLAHISTSTGLINDEMDALDFVNRLRALDERNKP